MGRGSLFALKIWNPAKLRSHYIFELIFELILGGLGQGWGWGTFMNRYSFVSFSSDFLIRCGF